MIDVSKQGTYTDASGYQWVFYQDDTNPNDFYVIPRPQWAYDSSGKLLFEVVKYATSDSSNGSGWCRIGVELASPQAAQSAVSQAAKSQFGVSNPSFQPLQYNPGGAAYLNFTVDGTTTQFTATAASFGGNAATFILQLTASQMTALIAAFSGSGSGYVVQYLLTVPAYLRTVRAILTFDSTIAYQYQVTQPQHHMWGKDTPGSTSSLLTASQSSNVTVTWGETDPPASLETAVADWANTTLATLVSNEVSEELALEGMTSSDSFDICVVNNVTEFYEQDSVVDWTVQPQAALSTLPALGLNISNYTTTVNAAQQVMAVTTDLPFQVDAGASSGNFAQMQVESISITASYPGLTNATATLTSNGTAVFAAPYSASAGPEWSLSYTVTYAGGSTKISGSVSGIDETIYPLSMPEVGILTVTFDAAQAFSGSSGLSQIDISVTFVDVNGAGDAINESATISATDSVQRANITTTVGVPLTTSYNYTLTYVYQDGVTYTPPTATGGSGFSQTIYGPGAIHSTSFTIMIASSDPNPISSAVVNVWYPNPPSIPGLTGEPTQANPSVLTLVPASSGGYNFASAVFSGYVNGDQPLMYSASIDAANGAVAIGSQTIENDQATVLISTTQRYFTLKLSMSDITWSDVPYKSIKVQVTMNVNGTGMTPRTFTWNSGEKAAQYLTVPIQEGQSVSYSWKTTFIQPGMPNFTVPGSGTSATLTVPPG